MSALMLDYYQRAFDFALVCSWVWCRYSGSCFWFRFTIVRPLAHGGSRGPIYLATPTCWFDHWVAGFSPFCSPLASWVLFYLQKVCTEMAAGRFAAFLHLLGCFVIHSGSLPFGRRFLGLFSPFGVICTWSFPCRPSCALILSWLRHFSLQPL